MGIVEQPAWVFRLTSGVAARLAPLSLVLIVAAAAVYALLGGAAAQTQAISSPLMFVVVFVAVIVVHEALHGVGFAAFGGRPRFGVGLSGGMPYAFATSPGRRFPRGQFLVIGLLPLVVIDATALALLPFHPAFGPGLLAFAMNTGGAVGDLWMVALILQAPRGTTFEDSDGSSLVAWAPPGSSVPAALPHGLDPRGWEWGVAWVGIAFTLFMLLSIAEFLLAAGAAGGTLAVAGVELARVRRHNGQLAGGRVSMLPALGMAIVLATLLTAAGRALARRVRRR